MLPVRVDLDALGVGEAGQDLLPPRGVAGLGLDVDAADLEKALRGSGRGHGCGHTLFNPWDGRTIPTTGRQFGPLRA